MSEYHELFGCTCDSKIYKRDFWVVATLIINVNNKAVSATAELNGEQRNNEGNCNISHT